MFLKPQVLLPADEVDQSELHQDLPPPTAATPSCTGCTGESLSLLILDTKIFILESM